MKSSMRLLRAEARGDGLLDAVEQMVVVKLRQDAETKQRLLCARGFQTRQREVDAALVAMREDAGQRLRRGEVDLDDTAGFEHDELQIPARLDRGDGAALEIVGIEERQRRLEREHQYARQRLAFAVRIGGPP